MDARPFGAWEEPQSVLADLLAALGSPNAATSAAALLTEFGCLEEVLGAGRWSLRRQLGWRVATAVAKLPDAERGRLLEWDRRRPLLRGRPEVERFVREFLEAVPAPALLAIYTDSRLRLVRVMDVGDACSHGSVDAAAIMRRGAAIGAAGFFLVHCRRGPHEAEASAAGVLFDPMEAPDGDVPLLGQLIVGSDEVQFVGGTYR